MPRIRATIGKALHQLVSAYAHERDISESAAVAELLAQRFENIVPAQDNTWGDGERFKKEEQLALERLEVRLMGLPPLADDD